MTFIPCLMKETSISREVIRGKLQILSGHTDMMTTNVSFFIYYKNIRPTLKLFTVWGRRGCHINGSQRSVSSSCSDRSFVSAVILPFTFYIEDFDVSLCYCRLICCFTGLCYVYYSAFFAPEDLLVFEG
jgi:hypothetical protein